jgi:hypothetical protein
MSKCNCRTVQMGPHKTEGVCYCEAVPFVFDFTGGRRWDVVSLVNACYCVGCLERRWRPMVRGRVVGKGLLCRLVPDVMEGNLG